LFQKDWKGSDTLGLFIRAGIYGHSRKFVEPAGLSILAAAGDTYPKGGQSWVPGLSIQKDGMLYVSGHDHLCDIRINLEAHCSSHRPFNLYEQWELDLTGKGCQSSIWRGCNEVRVEWVPFYPYVELVGQIAGKGDFVRAGFLPAEVLRCVLQLQEVEGIVVLQGLSVANFEQLSSSIVKLAAMFEVAPYRREERAKRELDLEPVVLPREVK